MASLTVAAANVLAAVAAAITPPPDTSISEWLETKPIELTARTNTPKEGPLSLEGVEYLREPIDRLHPDDPCTRVTIRGGAQSAKSTVGQIWVCWSVENAPRSFAIGLPSAGEISKYNELKLEPLLDDSPRLKDRIDRRVIRGKPMSDGKKKTLLTGATLRLFNLASPKELQMISTGNLILEEVGNALVEVGTRGSPVAQARERQAAYSVIGSKELMVSTPSVLGECEVTKAEQEGDQDGVEAVDSDEDDEDGQTEAQKIAGSAEAAANPKAANAAIASGMTFAQFKGQVRAQGGQGGGRRLAGVLGGSPRLGADAKGGVGRDKGLDPSAIYKRRANRARPQST